MAQLRANPIVTGLSGKFGNQLVFRQVRGKTILASVGRKSKKKQSEAQRTNRHKFRKATYFAKAAIKDPEQKAYYARKAKKLKLPNAYTAAITDYMRKGEVVYTNVNKITGKAGDTVNISARKIGFALQNVTVSFIKHDGASIHSGAAISTGTEWRYKIPIGIDISNTNLIVVLHDFTGQTVEKIFPINMVKTMQRQSNY